MLDTKLSIGKRVAIRCTTHLEFVRIITDWFTETDFEKRMTSETAINSAPVGK